MTDADPEVLWPPMPGPDETRDAPARAETAVTLELDGEILVYLPATRDVHRLDRIGALVWNLLDGRATVDELVSDLAAAFEVDQDMVRGHVADLLHQLGAAFLLAGGPGPPPAVHPQLLTNPPSP